MKHNTIDPNSSVGTKPKTNFFGVLFWVIICFLLIPLIVHVTNINRLKRLKVKIDEAEAGIDIQLKRRRDTLIKLIDSVKESISFEKEMQTTLTSMRTGGGVDQLMRNASKLNDISKQIQVQVENYANLKSNDLIRDLMSESSNIEENISASRRIYNSNVSEFNQSINVYPSNLAANQLGYKFMPFFEIQDTDREDVKIKF
ncbi:LemA family protein [Spiroplasma turonicum]|uniref:LemA family protein n=1 Tax=Spiroplasma turonicum TaxID=216946 RepID=A0A0K1P6A1_9MOLU|nr:LemA family protein [Spiroplasma turonicum]AKU79714.1 LemA family protein [Spiroplasma turonicum]ALX70732.1 LemA family protein [Spiroplasma turonicum]